MENALQTAQQQTPQRDINVITAEIRELTHQARTMALYIIIELGRRLVEAKEVLPHGEWGKWLSAETEFTQSTANNYMRLYEEYGAPQLTLFGAVAKSQTFANLPYTKALSLLAVPSEEREKFAEEVNAEELSVRELKAAIEERDKERRRAEQAEAAKADAEAKAQKAEKAAEEARKLAASAEELQQRCYDLTAQALKDKTAAKELQKKLDDAKANPSIPKETLDKLKKEAETAAQKAADEKAQKALEEARKKAEKATAEAIKAKNAEAEARANLEEARKQLKTANPEIAAFKALFDDLQATAAKLKGMIEKVRMSDEKTAEQLSQALHAFGARL